VRLTDGRVETRPIRRHAATRGDARGGRALEAELLADAKERAEHLMLVDLARNDIGPRVRAGERGGEGVCGDRAVFRMSCTLCRRWRAGSRVGKPPMT